jgi:solute carrier family 25 (adenine nucleotide translocator) protein 4/5/6/31
MNENLSNRSNFFRDFSVGSISAAISKTTFAPIERITMMRHIANSNVGYYNNLANKNIIDFVSRLIKENSLSFLWRGNITNLIRYIPT